MTLRRSGCRVAAAPRKGLPGVRRHRRALVFAAMSSMAISLTLLAGLGTGAPASPITAYVTNLGSNSVTPIDVATNKPGPEIKVGEFPEVVAITPDDKTAYVTNAEGNSVTPIDVATNKPGAEIKVGEAPTGIAITPPKSTPTPTNKGQCEKGGWHELADRNGTPFKNQGACVSYVASGGS